MKLTPSDRVLEKAVRKEHPGLLDNLPGDKKKHVLQVLSGQIQPGPEERVLVQTQVTTSSPVPPAELLLGYNSAFENGGERLFRLVENQSTHRQTAETKVIDAQIQQSARGQMFAFIIALVFGIMGLVLAIMNHPGVAGTIFGTTVVGLVIAFITGQRSQTKSLDKKNPDRPPGKK